MSEPLYLKVPTNRIRPNPNNPRHVFPPGAVEAMEASLRAIGQQTAVKVRPLTEAEKAQDPGHDYELIGGHIRHAGAQRAGLAALDVQVCDLTPDQARVVGAVDNMSQQMNWLEVAEAMDSLLQMNPKPTQQAVADMLGVYQKDVSLKLGILSLLTMASREAIYTKSIKVFDGGLIPQAVVARLTALGDPDKVEKALNVAIDSKMTEPQAKKLVEWVKAGNSPDAFPDNGKLSGQKGSKQQRSDPSDPNAELWKGLPKTLQIHPTPKGYKLTWNLTGADAPAAVYGAMAALEHLKEQSGAGPADPRFSASLPDLVAKGLKAKEAASTPNAGPPDEPAPPHVKAVQKKLNSAQELNLQDNLILVAHAGKTVLIPVAKSLTHLGLKAGRKLLKLGEKEAKKETRVESHHSHHREKR